MNDNVFVIIPSLNPDQKLKNTVKGMLDIGFKHVIVVNDGSDREHLEYFPQSDDNITVIHRRRNSGKGAALKVAFRHILRNYPEATGAVTVDGDGQHSPEDALACADALAEGNDVVLGCRDFSGPDVPKRSRIGNNTTSAVFKLLCGINLSDTQTGLRAFSIDIFELLLSVKGDRFEYETNMLLKFKQYGIEMKEIPIKTIYIEENASSHFRPIIDSIKIYRFILSYALSSCVCFLTDILLFYIISKLTKGLPRTATVVIATAVARAVSSFLNYNINRKTVFDSNAKGSRSLARYYALAVPQMLISAFSVSIVSEIFMASDLLSTVIKAIIDTILFFVSYRIQQSWVFANKKTQAKKVKVKQKLKPKTIIGRTVLSIFTAIVMLLVTVYSAGLTVCYGPSKSLRNMLVIMAKEASATKWAPSLFLPQSTIDQIIEASETINTDVITVDDIEKTDDDEWADAKDGMKLIFLNEPKFKGYLLLVKDPSRVSVGVSSNDFENATEGMRIFDMVSKYNSVAAINAGEFLDTGGVGKGSAPMGLTYSNGKNVWNDGLKRTFIGFDSNNKLICRESMTKKEADALGIRDAVSFQNGNVLIEQVENEVKLYKADNDTGTAQRTAIGQRADGAVIMLVTDGRSTDSIGATRNDVIEIMLEYGAVNAGMLDGGSSAMLYYRNYFDVYSVDKSQLDQYQLKGLVNRYKAFTNPRRIPTYFIVAEEQ